MLESSQLTQWPMWSIHIASEPVWMPPAVLSEAQLGAHRQRCHLFEFSATWSKLGQRDVLSFFDRDGDVPLCGHATLGALALARHLGHRGDATIQTSSGDTLLGEIQKNSLHITMPSPSVDEDASRWPISSCRNPYALIEVDELDDMSVDRARDIAAPVLASRELYGVIFFELIRRTERQLHARNIAVFGTKLQVDRSPCGTGSVALAGYLARRGQLGPGDTLRVTSWTGYTFSVCWSGPNSTPTLEYTGPTEIAWMNP